MVLLVCVRKWTGIALPLPSLLSIVWIEVGRSNHNAHGTAAAAAAMSLIGRSHGMVLDERRFDRHHWRRRLQQGRYQQRQRDKKGVASR
jgi:hypothetical protein